jgi:hypothetical protein
MTTIRKPSNTSKPNTARKAPMKVAVKKAVAVKKVVKKPSANTKSTLIVKKTPAQTPAVKPLAATQGVAAPKLLKERKVKLVRDSFTIPKPEYLVLDALKARALELGQAVKKSELLRAGIKALAAMNDTQFLSSIKAVPALKSGRPSK